MNESSRNSRVLIVTPEVTYLPHRMGGLASFYTAKAGGLADVSAALISALFEQGADVHVAMPDYRALFSDKLAPVLKKEMNRIQRKMPDDRIHLAEDRAFFYTTTVYSHYGSDNIKIALAFQREIINNIRLFSPNALVIARSPSSAGRPGTISARPSGTRRQTRIAHAPSSNRSH